MRHPAIGVSLVLALQREGRDVQGVEGVTHHGQFFRARLANARLHRARMRAVRESPGVQAEVVLLHPPAAHEVALGVVDHLVRVHVGVVVRRGDGERVIIEQARDERADDEVPAFPRLVHGRGLVHAPGDRLEVRDVEGVRIYR